MIEQTLSVNNRESPLRRGSADSSGTATVELAFVAPVLLGMLAIVVLAGQGLDISRKVTQTASTLTDLATQQANIGATCATATPACTFTYSQILGAAAYVIAPYDTSKLSMVLSEIQTNGTTTGTVVWSQANANGVALTTGSSVTVPTQLVNVSYLILGTASYVYTPVGVYFPAGSLTLNETIYLPPRAATNVACCT